MRCKSLNSTMRTGVSAAPFVGHKLVPSGILSIIETFRRIMNMKKAFVYLRCGSVYLDAASGFSTARRDETFRFKVGVRNRSILNPCETMKFVWSWFL